MVELINKTNTANIYGIYDKSGAVIGTVEVKLIGPECGAHAYTLTGKYTRRDIMRIYQEGSQR